MMDTLHDTFGDQASHWAEAAGHDHHDEDEIAPEPLPLAVGRQERRLQVRAYNLWTSLLAGGALPALRQLEQNAADEFTSNSIVMLRDCDGSDARLRHVGERLLAECGLDASPARVSMVPPASLLACLSERYDRVVASGAPLAFEAELPRAHSATILARGILLPFIGPDGAPGAVWGAVNWKEAADRGTTDALLREIGAALLEGPAPIRGDAPMIEWADAPLDWVGDVAVPGDEACMLGEHVSATQSVERVERVRDQADAAVRAEAHAQTALHRALGHVYELVLAPAQGSAAIPSPRPGPAPSPIATALDLTFPLLPRRRRAAYAAVLRHALRLELGADALTDFLDVHPGGIKAIVTVERRLRRADRARC